MEHTAAVRRDRLIHADKKRWKKDEAEINRVQKILSTSRSSPVIALRDEEAQNHKLEKKYWLHEGQIRTHPGTRPGTHPAVRICPSVEKSRNTARTLIYFGPNLSVSGEEGRSCKNITVAP